MLYAIAGLRDFRPSIFGKANTFAQVAAVFFVMLFQIKHDRWVWLTQTTFLRATFAFTIVSAVHYVLSRGSTPARRNHVSARLPNRREARFDPVSGVPLELTFCCTSSPLMALRLYNTLSGKIEEFHPLQNNEVRMYACGPTVYDYGHIGNFRTFVAVDILRRFLRQSGTACAT